MGQRDKTLQSFFRRGMSLFLHLNTSNPTWPTRVDFHFPFIKAGGHLLSKAIMCTSLPSLTR
jgi:hypothetical protein